MNVQTVVPFIKMK